MGPTRLAVLACVATAAVAVAGCGSGTGPGAGRPGVVLGVAERDFHITAPLYVHAGTVTLRVHNHGPDTHELFVVRTGSDQLPLRADGLTVNEDAITHATLASIDNLRPGHVRDLRLRLPKGRYLLFCNMAGHFRGGMRTALVVQ